MRRIALFGLCLWLSACGDSGAPSTTTVAPRLKPEMLVRATPGAHFACRSEDDFTKALGHAVRDEDSKFAAMFRDFTCMRLPEGQRYRLLAVKRTMVEFTHASNTTESEGMWTAVETFTPDEQK